MTNYIEVHKNRPHPVTGVIQWREDEHLPDWYASRRKIGEDPHSIRLPDTHWAVAALKDGWRPWAGGEQAPDDYDGGEVLMRCGKTRHPIEAGARNPWLHDAGMPGADIIGYKPKPTKPEQVSPELVERLHKVREQISLAHSRLLAHAINWAGVSHARETEASEWAEETRQHLADFDAIMADMQPVDPLVEEAREIVRAFYPEMKPDYNGRRLAIAIEALKRGRQP